MNSLLPMILIVFFAAFATCSPVAQLDGETNLISISPNLQTQIVNSNLVRFSEGDLTEKKSLFMRILKGFTPNQHLHGAASGREDSLIDDLSFNNVVEWIAEDAVESVAERIIESIIEI